MCFFFIASLAITKTFFNFFLFSFYSLHVSEFPIQHLLLSLYNTWSALHRAASIFSSASVALHPRGIQVPLKSSASWHDDVKSTKLSFFFFLSSAWLSESTGNDCEAGCFCLFFFSNIVDLLRFFFFFPLDFCVTLGKVAEEKQFSDAFLFAVKSLTRLF